MSCPQIVNRMLCTSHLHTHYLRGVGGRWRKSVSTHAHPRVLLRYFHPPRRWPWFQKRADYTGRMNRRRARRTDAAEECFAAKRTWNGRRARSETPFPNPRGRLKIRTRVVLPRGRSGDDYLGPWRASGVKVRIALPVRLGRDGRRLMLLLQVSAATAIRRGYGRRATRPFGRRPVATVRVAALIVRLRRWWRPLRHLSRGRTCRAGAARLGRPAAGRVRNANDTLTACDDVRRNDPRPRDPRDATLRHTQRFSRAPPPPCIRACVRATCIHHTLGR